jgi:hypothetical protein
MPRGRPPARPNTAEDSRLCPLSRSIAWPVGWITVAALARGRVPPRQQFRICFDPDCEVVYFGSAATVLRVGDLNVRPGFKTGSDGLLCYCFLHRREDVARQLQESGRTSVLDEIGREVGSRNCACQVRNPLGRCCLGEVREAIRTLEREVEVAP